MESNVFVVGIAAKEGIKKLEAEDINRIDAAPIPLQEMPQQTVRDRKDVWFVLLDVVPREISYEPPGIAHILPHCLIAFLKLSLTLNMLFSIPSTVRRVYMIFLNFCHSCRFTVG